MKTGWTERELEAAGKASCGCVRHAEDGIPCVHDLLLLPEVRKSVCHDPRVTDMIRRLLGIREMTERPTEEEKRLAAKNVERVLRGYQDAFRSACMEVLGAADEDPGDFFGLEEMQQ